MYNGYDSLRDFAQNGKIDDIVSYIDSMDLASIDNNHNPLFYAFSTCRKDVVDLLIEHKIHTLCDPNLLYIISVCYDRIDLTEYALSMGANINFIPSRDFLYRYDHSRYISYKCFHNDDNDSDSDLSDYILFHMTWEIVHNYQSHYPNYLEYLATNGINLLISECDYLKYELYNSSNCYMLDLVMRHCEIPHIILEKFFKMALSTGHQKYYEKLKNLVDIRYELIEEVMIMWNNYCNRDDSFSVYMLSVFNRKIDFFIDNVYYQCTDSIHDIFNAAITNILNLCIRQNKSLLLPEVFEKLAFTGYDFMPYINDILIIGLYKNDLEIIKFVRSHYNITNIFESLNEKIMKI